ncbi:hypothetical protein DF268_43265 [Streptomyces sp. V2]|nr:hypothetical protein DF268_43265 [Streptomyces sp. V2]
MLGEFDTTSGPLRGHPLPAGNPLFAGVPFAAPPVGDLRLRPPQPPAPWTDVRDATRFAPAPAPVQSLAQPSTFPAFPTAEIEETSEDCLYLNVWTQPAPGPHPVILWIYGGGFEHPRTATARRSPGSPARSSSPPTTGWAPWAGCTSPTWVIPGRDRRTSASRTRPQPCAGPGTTSPRSTATRAMSPWRASPPGPSRSAHCSPPRPRPACSTRRSSRAGARRGSSTGRPRPHLPRT